MPSLYLFGRRTVFAGDDLQPTAILTIIARSFQFILFILPLFVHSIFEERYFLSLDNDPKRNRYSDEYNENYRVYYYNVDGDNYNAEHDNGWYHFLFGGGTAYPSECKNTAHLFPLLLSLYILFSTLHSIYSIGVEYSIYRIAGIGTPTQPESRTLKLQKILEKKWVYLSLVANALMVILGLTCFAGFRGAYYSCRDLKSGGGENMFSSVHQVERKAVSLEATFHFSSAWWVPFILLLISQCAELFVSVVFLVTLLRQDKDSISFPNVSEQQFLSSQSNDNLHDDVSSDILGEDTNSSLFYSSPDYRQHELAEEMWNKRCDSFCKFAAFSTCFLFGGQDLVYNSNLEGNYGDVARALADYFEDGGVLDLVASDLAAGFVMLQRVQRLRILEAREAVLSEKKSGSDVVTWGGATNADAVTASAISAPSSIHSHNSSGSGLGGSKSFSSLHDDRSGHKFASSTSSSFGPLDDAGVDKKPPAPAVVQERVVSDNVEVAINTIDTSSTTSSNLFFLPDGTSTNETQILMSLGNKSHMALTLRMMPEKGVRNSTNWYEAKKRKVLSRNNSLDTEYISEGARFARHALAIYTWVLYVYMYPGTGVLKLAYRRCAEVLQSGRQPPPEIATSESGNRMDVSSAAPNSPTSLGSGVINQSQETSSLLCCDGDDSIIGDNFWHAHRNALLAHAGLDKSDLVYANFSNKYNEMPYCIVVDHKWQSVVLAIRGTLSLEDCVIDVLLEPDSLEELGKEHGFNAEGQHCHSGVLGCATYIYKSLQQHGILDSLLLGPNSKYPHYRLRITGHSLGAGSATLLGFMMRRKYPDLRVISISPPGGFLSWRLAIECKDFVTSFVLDSDLVPRLSIDTMEQLRDEVLELIGRIKVPKVEVARTFLSNGVCCHKDEHNDSEFLADANAKILHHKGSVLPYTDFSLQMEKFKAIQIDRKKKRGETREIALYPPGKIIHLVKTGERSSCVHAIANCLTCCTTNIGYEYTPVWAENDDFNEILVSPTMGTDHFPNRVCLELEGVAAAFGIDTTIGSSTADREAAERSRDAMSTPDAGLC